MIEPCQPNLARSAASRCRRQLSHAETITIDAAPEAVYDLVSDVTRTGEWSPICRAAWWDDGDGPRADAWFTGRNQTGDTVWETRSRVEIADRPREFAWLVSDGFVRWGYQLDAGRRRHRTDRVVAAAPPRVGRCSTTSTATARTTASRCGRVQALEGIPITLAAIKKIAES